MRITTILGVGLIGSLTLSACVPAQPYNPNDPNQRTRNGAVLGALGGAVLGAATGDSNDKKSDRILGGALIGGMLGAGVGNMLDQQASELQQQIHTNGVQIINEGNQLRVIMPEGILFPVDSASVQPGIMSDLYTVADSLNRYPNTSVQVIGHTDNSGAAAYNQDLSERRALAVAGVLRNGGVNPGRIAAFGRGETQPVASNLSASGKAQNRRVEILIIPNR